MCLEFTEVYTPPAINYGMVYPPAIMVFILTLTYSVISPLILIFGALYFGIGCEFRSSRLASLDVDRLGLNRHGIQVQAHLW